MLQRAKQEKAWKRSTLKQADELGHNTGDSSTLVWICKRTRLKPKGWHKDGTRRGHKVKRCLKHARVSSHLHRPSLDRSMGVFSCRLSLQDALPSLVSLCQKNVVRDIRKTGKPAKHFVNHCTSQSFSAKLSETYWPIAGVLAPFERPAYSLASARVARVFNSVYYLLLVSTENRNK